MRLLIGLLLMAFLVVPSANAQGLVSINIVDTPRPQDKWGYAPASRRVPVGTWVTWSNAGEDAHTVTAMDLAFDSDVLNPSEGFSFYFDTPGTYSYVCTLHTWMVGTVIVGDGIAPPSEEAPPPPDEAPPPPDEVPADG